MASPPPPPGGGGPGGPGGPPPGGPGGSVASTSYSTVLFISQVSMMLKESLFYCGLIQLVIILYMYLRVGKGRLWMAFLYSTLCLFSGKVLEHILKSLINFKETSKYSFIFCIPLETFYIASNYTISYINLIKLRALTDRPYVKRVKLLISIVFPFYCTSRYFIGYFRYVDKDFNSERARNCKGLSYTILGCLNIFMTFFIYRELKYNYRKERTQSNYLSKITFYRYVRKSNYAVLILLNLCSFILSFINYSYIKGSYIDLMCIPECIQDNLLFFLAIDTLIYKADYFKMLNSQGATVGGDIHHRHYLNKSSSNGISNSNSKTSLTKSVPIITSYNSNSNSNNLSHNNSINYYGNLSHQNSHNFGKVISNYNNNMNNHNEMYNTNMNNNNNNNDMNYNNMNHNIINENMIGNSLPPLVHNNSISATTTTTNFNNTTNYNNNYSKYIPITINSITSGKSSGVTTDHYQSMMNQNNNLNHMNYNADISQYKNYSTTGISNIRL